MSAVRGSSVANYHAPRMIRRDKQEGWLQLQPEAFVAWTSLNSVSFGRVAPGNVDSRGGALLATEVLDADHDQSSVLLTVPRDLILSIERVQEHAKVDRDYRELLESLGDFGRVGFAHVQSSFYIDCLALSLLSTLPSLWLSSPLN